VRCLTLVALFATGWALNFWRGAKAFKGEIGVQQVLPILRDLGGRKKSE